MHEVISYRIIKKYVYIKHRKEDFPMIFSTLHHSQFMENLSQLLGFALRLEILMASGIINLWLDGELLKRASEASGARWEGELSKLPRLEVFKNLRSSNSFTSAINSKLQTSYTQTSKPWSGSKAFQIMSSRMTFLSWEWREKENLTTSHTTVYVKESEAFFIRLMRLFNRNANNNFKCTFFSLYRRIPK